MRILSYGTNINDSKFSKNNFKFFIVAKYINLNLECSDQNADIHLWFMTIQNFLALTNNCLSSLIQRRNISYESHVVGVRNVKNPFKNNGLLSNTSSIRSTFRYLAFSEAVVILYSGCRMAEMSIQDTIANGNVP